MLQDYDDKIHLASVVLLAGTVVDPDKCTEQDRASRHNSGSGILLPFEVTPPQQPLPSPWETLSNSPPNDSSLADLTSPNPSIGLDHLGNTGALETLFSDGRPSDKFHAEEGECGSPPPVLPTVPWSLMLLVG